MRLLFIKDFELGKEEFFRRSGQSSIHVEYQILTSIKNSGLIYSLHFLDPYVDLFISSIDVRSSIRLIVKNLRGSHPGEVDELVEFLTDNSNRDGFFVFFGD